MATADGARRLVALALSLFAGLAFAAVPAESPPAPAPAPVAPMAPAPRIGVLTMAPGEVFFERFGHNAILVAPADGAEPVAYNFGYFDLGEDGFLGNFIAGRMRYMLVALPAAQDLQQYRESGRGVGVQWLDLEPAQAL